MPKVSLFNKSKVRARRIYPRDLLDRLIRNKDGSIQTIALPRGKAYPYSSVRQIARDQRKAEALLMAICFCGKHDDYGEHRYVAERNVARQIMIGEIRDSMNMGSSYPKG